MHTIEQIPQLPVPAKRSWQYYLLDSLLGVVGSLIVTAIIYFYRLYPTIPDIAIVYLLVIFPLASIRGRYAALVASVVAFLSFDFFLVPPYYSFTIARPAEWLALVVFLVTALITSQLTIVTRQSREQAWLREREARILYEAGRVITGTDNLDEQLDAIALSLVRVFSCWGVRACALLLPDEKGVLRVRADAPISVDSFTLTPYEMVAAQEALEQRQMREVHNAVSSSRNALSRLIPLRSGNQVLGVLCLRIEDGVSWFASPQQMQDELEQPTDQATFFWTFLDQAILVIERSRLRAPTVADKQ
ncbi:MAG TPA: DUF4118 domain-containing protein [Ktedonobacteraceae bacterium]|nr:DUF4118 domain-containing protein [Ktedonobacteraceae bacterium]